MTKTFSNGDKVSSQSHEGEARGKVVKELNRPIKIKSHNLAASTGSSDYLVETAEGKRAAHKPNALSKN